MGKGFEVVTFIFNVEFVRLRLKRLLSAGETLSLWHGCADSVQTLLLDLKL